MDEGSRRGKDLAKPRERSGPAVSGFGMITGLEGCYVRLAVGLCAWRWRITWICCDSRKTARDTADGTTPSTGESWTEQRPFCKAIGARGFAM